MENLIAANLDCPYCGESIDVMVEVLDEDQEYIEDCQVCCCPIVFRISVGFDGAFTMTVRAENDVF